MSKGRKRWYCRACDKTSFGSQARAQETVERIASEGVGKRPRRAYECPYSNGWHLTSQEERDRENA